MPKSDSTLLFQVLIPEKSETAHKLLCDIEYRETYKSDHIRSILREHYRNRIPLGWEEYKRKHNL